MTVAQMNARQGELVDAVVAGFAEVAAAQARCARLVDELRRWSVTATDAVARGRGEEVASWADQRLAERCLVSEVACALRLPEGSASVLVAQSQALVHEHPATMAALSQGEVSYRHAEAVLDATTGLDETSRRELDVLLSERARTTTVAALKRVARRERERRDSRPLVERHQVAAVERHVELQPCQDGMAWLSQYLPAVQATAIFHRLTDIAVAVQGPDEPRTLAQLRADASVDLMLDDDARTALMTAPCDAGQLPTGETPTATSGTATSGTGTGTGSINDPAVTTDTAAHHTSGGPGQSIAGIADRISLGNIKPQVAVTIPVMTLLGHSEEPGDLAGHGPIDAHTARRLAVQAPSFLRILTHPETGTVLSVGRDRYAVPADLKTWLRIRDETCRFPGCSRRAQRCDIDHITDWAHGGTTDHHNLIHLCRHHHRLKHTTRWTVSTRPPGPSTSAPTASASPPGSSASPPSSSASPPGSSASPPGSSTAPPGSSTAPPGIGNRPHTGSSTGPPARQVTSPPDGPASRQGSPHHAPAHDRTAHSADVVHWTAPTGHSYIDHAARAMARQGQEEQRAPATVPDHGDRSQFPDEPPF